MFSAAAFASSGQNHETRLAITVDDLPEHGDLPVGINRMNVTHEIIKALRENGVKQPYGFLNGYFMHYDPAEVNIVREWLHAGYPLGNHTYEHTDLERVSAQDFISDIEKLNGLLRTLESPSELAQYGHLFRYPYLHEGETLPKRNTVRTYLRKSGYTVAQVTVDYHDWAWTDAYARCVSENNQEAISWLKHNVVHSAELHLDYSEELAQILFSRDIPHILLIHFGIFDAVTLDSVLRTLRERGVRFITLEEALGDPVYEINPNLAYSGERTFLEQLAAARGLEISTLRDQLYSEDRLSKVCMPQVSN